ncbi:MAG: hypothetical protein EXR75_14730 [Myxococcales bacterium]|nr:hypothetical protein [Myxococcales bacterium]
MQAPIPRDSNGYVAIDALLAMLSRGGIELLRAEFDELIAKTKNDRFELSKDGQHLRHSEVTPLLARRVVECPDGVRVVMHRGAGGLSAPPLSGGTTTTSNAIEFSWRTISYAQCFTGATILVLLSAAFAYIGYHLPTGISKSVAPGIALMFLAPNLYFFIIGCVSRMVVSINDDLLTVRETPLPFFRAFQWGVPLTLKLPIAEIASIYSQLMAQEGSRTIRLSFAVRARLRSTESPVLVFCRCPEDALYLEYALTVALERAQLALNHPLTFRGKSGNFESMK